MDFIQKTWSKAASLNKKVVLPESTDPRVLKATEIIHKSKLAQVILVGDEEKIKAAAKEAQADISKAIIANPTTHPKLDDYITTLTNRRKEKGMTEEMAREILINQTDFFGAMLVDDGKADGMVSGAVNTTANTIRATLQCVGTAKGSKILSSFFIMILPDESFGENGILFYADCAVMPNPNELQLADIANSTATSFKKIMGAEPRVGMLSFSTKGSGGDHPDVVKVRKALEIAKGNDPSLNIDGELQLDAALIEKIGSKKAPGSPVAGKANVLIFPDLDSGNIGYKLTQRLAKAEAIGPVIQGAAKPVNDLSRGCSVDDIVNVTAITALQAQ